MLEGWNVTTFKVMTRGGIATEYVWFNFPETTELHDYRFLGNTFRDRERIKRKQKRWLANLKRMPELERNALLNRIGKEFDQ
jgi:DNA adenine methylase